MALAMTGCNSNARWQWQWQLQVAVINGMQRQTFAAIQNRIVWVKTKETFGWIKIFVMKRN